MTKDCVSAYMTRRSLLQSAVSLISLPSVANVTAAWGQEKLSGSGEVVVFTYGGSFTEGVRQAVYDPFTKATGIRVVDVVADSCEPQLKAMQKAGRMDWDVAFSAIRTGLIGKSSYTALARTSSSPTCDELRPRQSTVARSEGARSISLSLEQPNQPTYGGQFHALFSRFLRNAGSSPL